MLNQSFAQSLRKTEVHSTYDVYELVNDSLFSGSPFELTVSVPYNQQPFEIISQKIVERPFYSNYRDSVLKPIIQVIGGGIVKKQQVTRFKVFQSRRANSTEFITQYLKFKVKKGLPKISSSLQIQDHPLNSGEWLKIQFTKQGIYSITPAQLREAGWNTQNINPKKIQVWGFDGNRIPERNNLAYQIFKQIPIFVDGEENATLDDSDRIYFYGNSAYASNRTLNNFGIPEFTHSIHYYSTYSAVFITYGDDDGMRMVTANNGLSATHKVTEFTDHLWKEEELYKTEQRVRSGRQWLGQVFSSESFAKKQVIFNDTLPGFVANSTVKVDIRYYSRSTGNSSFTTYVNGNNRGDSFITRISDLNGDTGNSANYRDFSTTISNVNLNNSNLIIESEYNTSSQGSTGWVDYIDVEIQRELVAERNYLQFFPPYGLSATTPVQYILQGFSAKPIVIDATEPYEPKLLTVSESENNSIVVYYADPLKRIVAQSAFFAPTAIRKVENQNISGNATFPDYLIVANSEFLEQAELLATYRQNKDGLRPLVVTQEQVFNEFSGGIPDIMAIRYFVKYFYDRASLTDELPKYLLLFGDTSFDYKNIQSDALEKNLVFTYQSPEFVNRTGSFGSDDFFGLLDPTEGQWVSTSELLDIGIGRIPAQTKSEAEISVDKIISYESNDSRFGDWRTLFTFAADDDFPEPDRNRDLHVLNADSTASIIDTDNSGIRLKKIYLFDYPIENTAVGRRTPFATRDLLNTINSGTLVVNYSGHGAEQVLSDERFFTTDLIEELNNKNHLTIFVTATCSFGRFDDNTGQSGAEKLFLHKNGGAVAALTTTRVVFTSSNPDSYNFGLNRALTQAMTTREDETGMPRRLGDIYQITKTTGSVGPSENSRRFILLGDPATRLALPSQQMRVTKINSRDINSSQVIGINSLEEVNVSGEVVGLNAMVESGYQGEVLLQVRDARRFVNLPSDRWNCYMPNCGYFVQNDILFNGRATVANGQFTATFILPKDLGFSGGLAKILLYAENGEMDATGAFSRISVTGISSGLQNDGVGPEIDLAMNDELFLQGAIVNNRPTVIVKLSDPSGINTAASGIGHELTATLSYPDGTETTTVLNEFLTTELDNFKAGEARYTFDRLEEGDYQMKVRAWDIFNNPSEQNLIFTVTNSDELVLRNVYNYPNPMHSKTQFVFEHNQPLQPLNILIRIFTLSGRPVHHIRYENFTTSSPFIQIEWDGRDQDGDKLATGTYLYHVKIDAETIKGKSSKERIEKLVIIN